MLTFKCPKILDKLTIEITTDCNLKCAGCPRTISIAKGNWKNSHISLNTFENILRNIPYTKMATLHGIGEPLLHPDFLNIVQMAKESRKFGLLKVTTNGITRSPEYMQEAVLMGLDQIWISVDSFDPIIALQMRRGSVVQKLEKNIRRCIELGIPLRISTVISRTNLHDLERLFCKLHELGNPIVFTQEFQDFGNPYGMLTTNDRNTVRNTFERLRVKFPDLNVVPPQFTLPENDLCMAPWRRPAVSVEGYLTPCCTTFDPTHFGFSNLAQSPLSELWYQEAVQNWLNSMHENQIDMCNGCGLNPRLNRPETGLTRSGKTGHELHVIHEA